MGARAGRRDGVRAGATTAIERANKDTAATTPAAIGRRASETVRGTPRIQHRRWEECKKSGYVDKSQASTQRSLANSQEESDTRLGKEHG